MLYIASKECKDKAYNVEDVILEAAQNATNSITTVSSKLASVQATLQPYSSASFVTSVNSIETTLNKTAANVQSKVLVNKKTYKRIVQIMQEDFPPPPPPGFVSRPDSVSRAPSLCVCFVFFSAIWYYVILCLLLQFWCPILCVCVWLCVVFLAILV